MSLPRPIAAIEPPTLLYLIKQVELVVRSKLDSVIADHGITTLQYTALTVLDRHPGITAAQLARNSFVRAQTTAQLIASVEQRGLITRQRDPQMRRQVLLFLTPEGHRLLEELNDPVDRIESELLAVLSASDARLLRSALSTIRQELGGALTY